MGVIHLVLKHCWGRGFDQCVLLSKSLHFYCSLRTKGEGIKSSEKLAYVLNVLPQALKGIEKKIRVWIQTIGIYQSTYLKYNESTYQSTITKGILFHYEINTKVLKNDNKLKALEKGLPGT